MLPAVDRSPRYLVGRASSPRAACLLYRVLEELHARIDLFTLAFH